LRVRMQQIASTTQAVLTFLQTHPKVEKIYYPHTMLANNQMRGASGLLTIQLRVADVAAVARFCDALKRFLMTVSWGGYESLNKQGRSPGSAGVAVAV